MDNNLVNKLSRFETLEQVSSSVMESIAQVFNVNTVYLAKREPGHMDVREVYNLRHTMVEKGMKVEYKESYCQFVLENSEEEFMSLNLVTDSRTEHVELAEELGFRTFLGATLYDRNGKQYGTLCLIDDEEKNLTDSEITLFKHIASLLSYLISLDQANHRMEMLSTPIVPFMKGIVVLPLVGIFDPERVDSLTTSVLMYCSDKDIDYFLIDMSGLATAEEDFLLEFIKVVDSLQLMGVRPIITGISADLIMKQGLEHRHSFKHVLTKATVEQALMEIGVTSNLV